MSARRPENPSSDRHLLSPLLVNKFAEFGSTCFARAGRKRDVRLSAAARVRRGEAARTADRIIQGGLRDDEIHVAEYGDTMLDLATGGELRDYLGRQRRRWHGYADQAHALKAKWGREYAAFCNERGVTQAIQVVVRPPVSIVPLLDFRETHSEISARLNERLRYGRQRIAPGLAFDLVSAEILPVAQSGAEVDLHFHLAARGTAEQCRLMQAYFQASGWTWWDSLTGGSENVERYPGALAQYPSKSLADAIRKANEGDDEFSPEKLAELYRQTRRIAMTRPIGTFRIWKGELARHGLVVAEDRHGRVFLRDRRTLPKASRWRDRLLTSTGITLLRLTVHDFGDGMYRPAARVRGREGISFGEVAAAYDLAEAVDGARYALSLASTAIPESVRIGHQLDDSQWPPWRSSIANGGPDMQPDILW